MENIYTLVSSDNEQFQIRRDVISNFKMIDTIVDDIDTDDKIPLPNITASVFTKVLEFARLEDSASKKDTEWRDNFMDIEDQKVFDLIFAANYLDYKSLLDLACNKIAKKMKDKTPEQIRKTFNITNDLTPEEEMKIIQEHGENAFE